MRKKRILVLIGSVCFALMLALPLVAGACAPAAPAGEEGAEAELRVPAEVFELKAQGMAERGTAYYNLHVECFEKPLEAASGGRIDVEIFGRDELVASLECIPAIQDGLLDIMYDAPAWHTGTIPAESVDFGLPGSFRTPDDVMIFWYNLGYMDWKQKNIFDDLGIKLISPIPEFAGRIMSSVPIKSVDDLKGMKMRAPGVGGTILSQLGVNVVEMSGTEAYTAGMSGIIDAVFRGGIAEMVSAKMYEPFPYLLLEPPLIDFTVCRIIEGMDTWNKLPEDLQHITVECGIIAGFRYANHFRLADMDELERTLEEGMIKGVCNLSGEDLAKFQEAKMGVWEPYAAENPLNAEAVEMLKSFVKKMGY